MKKRVVIALAACVLAAGGLAALRPAETRETAPMAAPEMLRAEAYVVEPTVVRDTVRTIGTLHANESVNLVAELSRRLVGVHVVEGTSVAAGALLFKLDDADLRAQLAELEVRRRLAARTAERQKALLAYDKKALSQQAFDQAMAELQAVEAQIEALRVTLAKTEIRAPFPARAGLRRVSEGAWITPETTLITLQDTSRIKIDFTLPERYAGSIAIGQPFSFEVAGRVERFTGKVVAIEPAIDLSTRSLLVRGVYEDASGGLLPGAFASVEVPIAAPSEGIQVPAQAVIPSATGHAVYVLRDGRAELREVEIGLRTRAAVEIRSGLAVGDTVLTSNLLRLRPGVTVEIVASEAPATAKAEP
ncbi:MAG: efflux RND transporter periplasmic adaptor subunit [Candidatus Binatia bacterium]